MKAEDLSRRNAGFVVVREFPPGCGSSYSSSAVKSVHRYHRDFPPECGTKPPKISQVCPKKRLVDEKEPGFCSGSSYWRRPVAAVKSKPPLGTKVALKNPEQAKPKEVTRLVDKERDEVLEMLKLFRERCEKIARTEKSVKRVDVKAIADLKNEGKIVNKNASVIGAVPGVKVGDRFYYRVELVMIGLHRLYQGGIDSIEYGGRKLATCIVANEGHFDKLNDPNVLMYVGEGGVLSRNEVGIPPDQQLKGGNRALWNSMKDKKPVRVVRGLRLNVSRPQKIVYVYDGLYGVETCEKKKGPQGNLIFEFQLRRYPGQTTVPWKTCRWG